MTLKTLLAFVISFATPISAHAGLFDWLTDPLGLENDFQYRASEADALIAAALAQNSRRQITPFLLEEHPELIRLLNLTPQGQHTIQFLTGSHSYDVRTFFFQASLKPENAGGEIFEDGTVKIYINDSASPEYSAYLLIHEATHGEDEPVIYSGLEKLAPDHAKSVWTWFRKGVAETEKAKINNGAYSDEKLKEVMLAGMLTFVMEYRAFSKQFEALRNGHPRPAELSEAFLRRLEKELVNVIQVNYIERKFVPLFNKDVTDFLIETIEEHGEDFEALVKDLITRFYTPDCDTLTGN